MSLSLEDALHKLTGAHKAADRAELLRAADLLSRAIDLDQGVLAATAANTGPTDAVPLRSQIRIGDSQIYTYNYFRNPVSGGYRDVVITLQDGIWTGECSERGKLYEKVFERRKPALPVAQLAPTRDREEAGQWFLEQIAISVVPHGLNQDLESELLVA